MTSKHTVIIEIWQGDWGLPSVDLDCIKILALLKFSGSDYEVKKTNNPFRTPNGSLPVVHHRKHKYCTFEEVLGYLKSKNLNPDCGLTTAQDAEAGAYINMLQEKLYPALQYAWWIDKNNYTNLTRKWYAKALSFPLNLYYPSKYMKSAKELISDAYDLDPNSEIESQLYEESEKCLTALSLRLGENEFMFGSKPTSVDAVMFACLAQLLRVPFKNQILQKQLLNYTNLHKYVMRVTQRYFHKDFKEYEDKIKAGRLTSSPEEAYPSSFFAAAFALFAMFGYAFSVGIFNMNEILLITQGKEYLPKIHLRLLWDWGKMKFP